MVLLAATSLAAVTCGCRPVPDSTSTRLFSPGTAGITVERRRCMLFAVGGHKIGGNDGPPRCTTDETSCPAVDLVEGVQISRETASNGACSSSQSLMCPSHLEFSLSFYVRSCESVHIVLLSFFPVTTYLKPIVSV